MKTLVFIFLISSSVFSQDTTFFNWWKLGQTLGAMTMGVSGAYADYNTQLKYGSGGADRVNYDKLAHNWRTVERASYLVTGVTIPLSSKGKFWNMVTDVLYVASVKNLFFMPTYNTIRGKPIFWQSDYQKEHNTSGFERFQNPYWTIGFFIIATIINYLVYDRRM